MTETLAHHRRSHPAQARFPRANFSAARFLFLTAALAMVVATLAPFTFAWDETTLGARLQEAAAFPSRTQLTDFPLHFTAFAALAILACAAHGRAGAGFQLTSAIAWGCALCAGLEAMQFLNPLRHARITDLVTNASGLSVGLWFSLRTRAGATLATDLCRWTDHHRLSISLALLLATGCGWVSYSHAALHRATNLNWDPTFPLLIGNEKDSSRPWSGTLGYVRFYGSALSPADVSQAHAQRDKREPFPSSFRHPLLGYDFRGSRIASVPAPGAIATEPPALRLHSGDAQFSDGGIVLAGSALLSTPSAPTHLIGSVTERAAFSIEAWFKPADLRQAGPARIVSISDGPRHRNVMVGQDGSALVFRVRNGVNGLNGSLHALEVPGGVSLDWQHVVAVYDHGVSTLYRNGLPLPLRVDVRDPSLSFPLARPESAWFILCALGAVGVTLPAAAALGRGGLLLRHGAAIALGLGVLLGPAGVNAWQSGAPLYLPALPWIVSLVTLCHAATALYCRKPATHAPSSIGSPGTRTRFASCSFVSAGGSRV